MAVDISLGMVVHIDYLDTKGTCLGGLYVVHFLRGVGYRIAEDVVEVTGCLYRDEGIVSAVDD